MHTSESRLVEAREAFEAGDFARARDSYEAVVAEDNDPEAVDGLGQALWFLGEIDDGIARREEAYAGFRRSRNGSRAAEIALWLVVEQATSIGNLAAANGWFQRAERLLAAQPLCPAHAQLEVARGYRCSDPAEAQVHFERAAEIGRCLADADREVLGLASLGNLRVALGDLEGGMALLDETMAAAMGGEVADPWVIGSTCCATLFACEEISDLARASQWCEAFVEFTSRRGFVPLSALCRAVYGKVLLDQGDWDGAESEFGKALEGFCGRRKPLAVYALARLGELRLRQGRFEDALRLLRGWEEHPQARATVIRLLAARGDTALAAAQLEQELDWLGRDNPAAAALFPTLVTVRLAEGDVAAAHEAADRLAAAAIRLGHDHVAASAQLAAGQVAAAAGDKSAPAHLTGAVKLFTRAGMPYETAVAQWELARALGDRSPEHAVATARAALAAFDRLGAGRAADEAAAFLRAQGIRGRSAPKRPGELTRREREVLTLLEQGLSNKEIAVRLYITPKTAGHHVSRILSKLEVRSRAEAAVYAARHSTATTGAN